MQTGCLASKEGIEQVTESLEIHKRLDNIVGQAQSWEQLARLLYEDSKFGATEEAASQVIGLLSDASDQFTVCHCYNVNLLGRICRSKGETKKAISYHETAIGIASSFNWLDLLFWNNYNLAHLFFGEKRFDDAHIHVERAKSHAISSSYLLGRAMELQAGFWYEEGRFEEAKTEASRAVGVYEGIGAVKDMELCKTLLQNIEEKMKTADGSCKSNLNGKFLETMSLPTPFNASFSA